MKESYIVNGRSLPNHTVFGSELKKSVLRRASLLHAEVVKRLVQNIIDKTPVDTGRTKSNWNLVFEGGTPKFDSSKRDGEMIVSGIPGFGLSAKIVNMTPYALSLEFGESKQAPAGMVRTSLIEMSNRKIK